MNEKSKIIVVAGIVGIVIGIVVMVIVGSARNGGVGAPGGMFAENYLPFIRYNDGYNSEKGITTSDTITGGTITDGVASLASGVWTGISTLNATIANFAGLLTTNAGSLDSYTNATSTSATTYNLIEADVLNYDTVIMTPNTGALTITWFASSTATNMVPSVGDKQEQCWFNATTTTAATITFVANTNAGIDWEGVATSTTSGSSGFLPAIPAGGHACFKFMRQPVTASTFDISVLQTPYINSD